MVDEVKPSFRRWLWDGAKKLPRIMGGLRKDLFQWLREHRIDIELIGGLLSLMLGLPLGLLLCVILIDVGIIGNVVFLFYGLIMFAVLIVFLHGVYLIDYEDC